jgi:hypothetical protein
MNCFPIRGMLSDTLTSARLLGRAQFSGTERLAPRWDFQVAFCPYSLPLTISKSFKNWAPRQGVLPRRPISCIPWGIKIKKTRDFMATATDVGSRSPPHAGKASTDLAGTSPGLRVHHGCTPCGALKKHVRLALEKTCPWWRVSGRRKVIA